jgi:hypothetical protein
MTYSSFARVFMRCGERQGREHDGGALQRPFPPVLRYLCLAQRQMGWPTP